MATTESRVDRETVRQLNLYEVLQVSAKASPEVVQAAYRVLARAYHPDVNASPHAQRMMRQLNAAYRVLSDPERRAKYDSQRAHMWRARTAATAARAASAATAAELVSAPAGPVRAPMTAPSPPSWRVGRLFALLFVLMLMMGAMLFAFWLIAGVLDEDPQPMLRAAMLGAHRA